MLATGDCQGTTITASIVVSNPVGLYLTSVQRLTVNGGNKITGNKSFGLYATGASAGTTVTGNEIVNNGVNIDTSTAVGGTFQQS